VTSYDHVFDVVVHHFHSAVSKVCLTQ